MPVAARFGPAGAGQSFYDEGYKSSAQVPEYLAALGLTAFEYQCGRGVNIGMEAARKLGALCRERGVAVSLHAPYYISLASPEEEKRCRSVDYILQSAAAVAAMGGDRIVVHAGGSGSASRGEMLALARETMRAALQALDDAGLARIHICPETMGRSGRLGDLDDVLSLCELDKRMIPCLDFGHLNAREQGSLHTAEDYAALLGRVERALGAGRLRSFHAHFSRIQYGKSGEVKHLTFSDKLYGPPHEPLMKLIARRGLSPVVICESAGTQAEDALMMQRAYRAYVTGQE